MSEAENRSLAYEEKETSLSIRINAHKKFSNFNLEDWIARHVDLKEGSSVFDIGCGNGNLFQAYSDQIGARGLIVGMDQSAELLQEAKKRPCGSLKLLLHKDMNTGTPFLDESFDRVFSSFAIYYANDAWSVLQEVFRLLKAGGEVVLIGPTDNNARELYEFNQKLFGFARDEKIDRRTRRIEDEFFPLFPKLFKDVSMDRIASELVFPDKEEFIRYYLATLLFEESVKKNGGVYDQKKIAAADAGSLKISKEMVVLRGKKGV